MSIAGTPTLSGAATASFAEYAVTLCEVSNAVRASSQTRREPAVVGLDPEARKHAHPRPRVSGCHCRRQLLRTLVWHVYFTRGTLMEWMPLSSLASRAVW
jgi:hypothetical protein